MDNILLPEKWDVLRNAQMDNTLWAEFAQTVALQDPPNHKQYPLPFQLTLVAWLLLSSETSSQPVRNKELLLTLPLSLQVEPSIRMA
jgi:hypothetical protein